MAGLACASSRNCALCACFLLASSMCAHVAFAPHRFLTPLVFACLTPQVWVVKPELRQRFGLAEELPEDIQAALAASVKAPKRKLGELCCAALRCAVFCCAVVCVYVLLPRAVLGMHSCKRGLERWSAAACFVWPGHARWHVCTSFTGLCTHPYFIAWG